MATIYCYCGGAWAGNSKTDYAKGVISADDPCPLCGRRDKVRRVSHERELFVVERKDTDGRA